MSAASSRRAYEAVAPTLVWFRQDLRLQDNPALQAAIARGGPAVPVYILDDAGEGRWAPGGASRWWLHHSLASLDASLREAGSRLVVLRGDSLEELRRAIRATAARGVMWNRRYEPGIVARDAMIVEELRREGLEVSAFNGALLHEPGDVKNREGKPFQVFTAYWRTCLALPVERPVKTKLSELQNPSRWLAAPGLRELELLPKVHWDKGLAEAWQPGEAAALKRLRNFVRDGMADYAKERNRPDRAGTSRLSAALHFGELSPRQIWEEVSASGRSAGLFPPNNGARVFLTEIGWREFAHHLLFHFPGTPARPLREAFERFPWAEDKDGAKLAAWRRGLTGYPIVDAGMRELWHAGWMHNRVRMIVASFLVKHLRLPWQRGAEWFWDTLVDADLANNTLGWQWSAGCGADAAPYFRIFAPVLQGRKFDPAGEYVRRWVPEIATLPNKWLHAPWEAPTDVLTEAGVELGKTYPRPIVDHATARDEALVAFKSLKRRP